MNTYRFKIGNYHSIAKADIALNGITVLAGVNGSGKSTLARWLYYIVNGVANGYEQYCFFEFTNAISILLLPYKAVLLSSKYDDLFAVRKISYIDLSSFDKVMEVYFDATRRVKSEIKKSLASIDRSEKNRIFNYLRIEASANESDDELLDKFEATQILRAKNIKNDYIKLLHKRSTDVFYECLDSVYHENDYPQTISFKEDEVEIINKDVFGRILRFNRAIYIDTPMVLSESNSDNQLWNEFRDLLQNHTDITKKDNVIRPLLSYLREITGGKVVNKKDIVGVKDELCFTRESDNLTVKLENMATGIKTFAYLDRLLENGYLNNNTILIIDEPEAHLHPQWIVEFARMLVYIHKETGLYVMLASHNPDMVSAIRYIAEKEKVLDNTTFYLAEKDNDAETYTYKNCAQDIEPIFASFNQSFELIEKYGEDNS